MKKSLTERWKQYFLIHQFRVVKDKSFNFHTVTDNLWQNENNFNKLKHSREFLLFVKFWKYIFFLDLSTKKDFKKMKDNKNNYKGWCIANMGWKNSRILLKEGRITTNTHTEREREISYTHPNEN